MRCINKKLMTPFSMGTTSSITIVQRAPAVGAKMWCLFFYRQDAAKRQTAGIKFTHRPKIRFFARRGDSLHRFAPNLAWPTGTGVRLPVQNFASIATGGGNAAPKISKKFHFLVNSGATPLTDFENFYGLLYD